MLFKIKKNKNSFFYIILLMVIFLYFLFVYKEWLFSLSILTKGDWSFFFPETARSLRINYFSLWLSDFSFGRVLLDVAQAPTYSLYGFLAQYFNMDFAVSERIVHMWPIVVFTPISSFLFIRKIFRSTIPAIIGSVVYCFNTYVLSLQTGHLTLMASFALAPLIILFFIKTLDEKKLNLAIITGLLSCLSIAYEPRAFYIIAIILFLYFLYYSIFISKPTKKNVLINSTFGFLPIGIIFLSNFYWIYGLSRVGILSNNELFNRGLFGNNFWNIVYSFTLHHPWWSESGMRIFINQPIPFYFWLVPFFAFLGWCLNLKNKQVLFFGFIALLGIFLSKQVGVPFTTFYQWMYDNFPGFNAFREASKFYFLIALGYSVLIGSFVNWLCCNFNKNQWHIIIRRALILFIIVLFLWNTKAIVTGEIGSLFIPREVPNDYIIFKNKILSENDYSRIFWTPRDSRWGIYTDLHSKISNIDIIQTQWQIYSLSDPVAKQEQNILSIFKKSFSDSIFDISSIKYVVVPIQDVLNEDDFFIDYGGRENPNIRQWYIDQLDKVSWLKKIDIGTKDLVVYENESYKPYISSLNNLYSFDSLANLDQKYDLINNTLNKEFSFVTDNKNENLTIVNNLFENVKGSDVSDKIKSEFELPNQNNTNTIYENKNKTNLYYSFNQESQVLNLYKKSDNNLLINGGKINQDSGTESVYQKTLSLDKKYYLSYGTKLIPLDKNKDQKLGTINQSIQIPIYSTDNQNLIPNASFQDGLWDKKVGDCNNYDDNPTLDMKLGTAQDDNTDNSGNLDGANDGVASDNQYLQLEAVRHIACTTNIFDVSADADYLFSFDYQSPNAKNAGYYLAFNDEAKTVISERIFVQDQSWQNYSRRIKSPAGATSARLYLYAYSTDDKTNIINRYDNFSLLELYQANEVKIEYQPEFVRQEISLQKENTFEYSDPDYKFENIISNGSFENGLWQEKVGDCNHYDDKGDLGMNSGGEANDGSKSLQLEAKKHTACTSNNFPVNENSVYLFSFDYQSPNAKNAGYYLQFNDELNTVFREVLDVKGKDWQNFEKKIRVPAGATSANLYVYAYESDKTTNNIVRYDNFKFIEIPDLEDKYYLVSDPNLNLKNPEKIDFELVNPTKKIVHIKGATTPFFLAMSESYHPQWQLEMNNSKINGFWNSWIPWVTPDKISDDNHLKLNDFLNAWYVDPERLCELSSYKVESYKVSNGCTKNSDGSYDLEMVVEFVPQRWFYLGLLISGTTLLACIGYLAYDWRKRKRRNES